VLLALGLGTPLNRVFVVGVVAFTQPGCQSRRSRSTRAYM
jgi:hypothetical protein